LPSLLPQENHVSQNLLTTTTLVQQLQNTAGDVIGLQIALDGEYGHEYGAYVAGMQLLPTLSHQVGDIAEENEEENDRVTTSRPPPCPFIDDKASKDISNLTDDEYEPTRS
jgi:hypothetical protein